jgi:nitroreductase/NAD-dependent dihydropyrimidine dehydrogenase PreA subunit
MITVDKNLCIKCGKCIKDCVVEILKFDENGNVFLDPTLEIDCINCQHCLAICPVGAISCNGVTPNSCKPIGNVPSFDEMLNLLSQRRTIRFFKDENLSKEDINKLKRSLAWSATGCNRRALMFKIVENKEEMSFYRNALIPIIKLLNKLWVFKLFFPRYKRFVKQILDGKDVVFRGAPHMIIVGVKKNSPTKVADPLIALSNFDLTCQTLGIGTCWCGFAERAFKASKKMRKQINWPKDYQIGSVMLFGKPDVTYARSTNPEDYPFL